MNKLANWIAGLLLAASACCVLADAPELTIFHSITIDAPADQVWAMAAISAASSVGHRARSRVA